MMRLTVLGSGPACPNPGGACSGYLLEQDGVALVLDCGSGVFGRLQRYVAPEQVQAVVISHMHADHTLDLVQYRYYLYFLRGQGRQFRPPALYLPPGGHDRLLGISRMQDESPTFYSDVFAVHEYDPGRPLQFGSLTLAFVPVRHIPHTYAMRVQGDALFAYSADSGPSEGLVQVAYQSDYFLCECANVEGSDYPLHLTPRQAGAVAAKAGVHHLLLTHRWWMYSEDSAVAEAREQYAGPVELAHEDMQITLAP